MDSRIKRLADLVQKYVSAQRTTSFLLENGKAFTTDKDPLTYLIENGVDTPEGHIVAFPHETNGLDDLTRSLYEEIDRAIAQGGFFPPFCILKALQTNPHKHESRLAPAFYFCKYSFNRLNHTGGWSAIWIISPLRYSPTARNPLSLSKKVASSQYGRIF